MAVYSNVFMVKQNGSGEVNSEIRKYSFDTSLSTPTLVATYQVSGYDIYSNLTWDGTQFVMGCRKVSNGKYYFLRLSGTTPSTVLSAVQAGVDCDFADADLSMSEGLAWDGEYYWIHYNDVGPGKARFQKLDANFNKVGAYIVFTYDTSSYFGWPGYAINNLNKHFALNQETSTDYFYKLTDAKTGLDTKYRTSDMGDFHNPKGIGYDPTFNVFWCHGQTAGNVFKFFRVNASTYTVIQTWDVSAFACKAIVTKNARPTVSDLKTDSVTNNPAVVKINPTFTFTYNDADSDPQYAYQIQVDDDPAFGSPIWDSGKVISASSSVVYAGSALSDNTTYYVRVRVWDTWTIGAGGGNVSDWTTGDYFATVFRSKPTGIEVQGVINNPNVNDPTPDIEWIHNDTNTPPDAQTHVQIQIDNDSGFGSLHWDSGEVAQSALIYTYDGSALASGVTYYIRVRTKDSQGFWSGWSDTTSFFTNFLGDVPVPLKGTPTPNGWTINKRPHMFIYPPDEGGTEDHHLHIQIDDDPAFGSPLVDANSSVSATGWEGTPPYADGDTIKYYTPQTDMTPYGTLYWRVRARRDSDGVYSEWGSGTTFVVHDPDDAFTDDGDLDPVLIGESTAPVSEGGNVISSDDVTDLAEGDYVKFVHADNSGGQFGVVTDITSLDVTVDFYQNDIAGEEGLLRAGYGTGSKLYKVTKMLAVYLQESEDETDAVELFRGIANSAYSTGDDVEETDLIMGVNITEIRDKMEAVQVIAKSASLSWTDDPIVSGTTPHKSIHIQEVRDKLKAI